MTSDQTNEAALTLLGQFRVDAGLQLSVLQEGEGRFLLIAETTGEFLDINGPQVWAISDERTARYFARCFSIPEPELFIEYSPHFRFLGTPAEVFPGGFSWGTPVDGPPGPGTYDEDTRGGPVAATMPTPMGQASTRYVVRVVRTFQLVEEVRTEASSPEEAEWLACHHIESVDRQAGIAAGELRELGRPVTLASKAYNDAGGAYGPRSHR